MARDVQSIDISDTPEILRLAEEVQRSKQPRLLRRADEELAVIIPVQQARRKGRGTGVITPDDPFVRMAGTGDSGVPGGISGRKYDFFRRAFGVDE